MKRTVSLLLLASCFSVIVVSCGCGSPKSTEPTQTEQTQPAPEAQQPVSEEQAAPAEEAQPAATETAPEATAAK